MKDVLRFQNPVVNLINKSYVTWDEKKILVGKKIKIEVLTDFYYIGCGLSNCATKFVL